MNSNNKKMIHLIVLSCVLFLSIIGYLTYFQIFMAAGVSQNNYNRRLWQREENTVRGTIYDRNGVVLAETLVTEDSMTRSYPFNSMYSHIVGYSHRQYGRTGAESYFNSDLMAIGNDSTVARLMERITGGPIRGNHVYLTLHHQLQQTAERLLRGKKGAIVAIDPRSGEILAMVSKPDFNPNKLSADWDKLVVNEESPLLNRGLAGMYPPGSTFKVIMSAAVLANGGIDTNYNCTGSLVVDGYTLSDLKAHGYLDLRSSLAVSCNTNFARMALELGGEAVLSMAKDFYFGKSLPGDIPIQTSRIPYNRNIEPTELAAVAIGQGKLLVTPIQMAVVAGIFANDGIMMSPRILKEVQSPEGKQLKSLAAEGNRIISPDIANEVKAMMEAVVTEGTGKNARISGVRVAGKTGTAENATGESHAWFIGFAPADAPKIAVAVILETEGRSGGVAAAPVARELMTQALKRGVLD